MTEPEELYFRDVLPEIEVYAFDTGFTSGEVSERLESYSRGEVEDILEYVAESDEIQHLQEAGDRWKIDLVEPEKPEEGEETGRAQIAGQKGVEALKRLDLDAENLSSYVYPRLRRNRRDLYQSLKKVKEESKNYFDSGDLEKYWEKNRKNIGVLLSGLAAAGLVKKYSDSRTPKLYEGDFDLDEVREFLASTREVESVEQLREILEEE